MDGAGARPSGRIHSMDELRGFAVFCMVFFHGFYTAGFLFGSEIGLYFFRFFTPAEPFFAGMFIFISGVACNLSHSNLGRGLKLLAVALGVTLVTGVFLPEDIITFGILHFLAVCMVACGLLDRRAAAKAARRRFAWYQPAACAALYLLTRGVPSGFLGPGGALSLPLPGALYASGWLAPLGLPGPGFASADYFPLLPWAFVFAAGVFTGRLAREGKFPAFLYPQRVPALSWLGKHALLIYLAHQPVIYGAALMISALMKRLAP